MNFKDKIIVILGGNSGIGLASAIDFAREGAKVIITGRNPETLEDAVIKIGHDAMAIRADTANLDELDSLFAQIKQKYGQIDVLFINSGIGEFIPFEQMTPDAWDRMQNINLRGPYFACQKAVPLMTQGGSIIFTSSIGHLKGIVGNSAYAASKAGIRALVRNIGVELLEKNIRVNCFSPGPIDTPLITRSGMDSDTAAQMKEAIRQQIPMKRWGDPHEAAGAVLFLASPQASFITGIDLVVDGGICSF